jgi:hypothetical protein
MDDWDYEVDYSADSDPAGMDAWNFTQSDLDALLAQDAADFGLTPEEALMFLQGDGGLSDFDIRTLDQLQAPEGTVVGLQPVQTQMAGQSFLRPGGQAGGLNAASVPPQQALRPDAERFGGAQFTRAYFPAAEQTRAPVQSSLQQPLFGPNNEINWQKMLALGAAGLGGLASYRDAQNRNAALAQLRQQQQADRQDALNARQARRERSAGNIGLYYGAPATTRFTRPV